MGNIHQASPPPPAAPALDCRVSPNQGAPDLRQEELTQPAHNFCRLQGAPFAPRKGRRVCGGRGAFLSSLHQRAAGPGRDTALPPPPLPSPPFLPSFPLLSSPPPGPQPGLCPLQPGVWTSPRGPAAGGAPPRPGSVEPHPASTGGASPTTRQLSSRELGP